MRPYRPKRANARWTEDAPKWYFDGFYFKDSDSYIIMIGDEFIITDGTSSNTWIPFIEIDSKGGAYVSLWGEMTAYESSTFRFKRGRNRVAWKDIPEVVRKAVTRRVEEDN